MLTVMKVTGKGLPWFNQLCQVSYNLYLLLHKQWKPRTKRSGAQADVPTPKLVMLVNDIFTCDSNNLFL